MSFKPKQGDEVLIKSTQKEAIVTGSEINTEGTWYYLNDAKGYVKNEEKDRMYFTLEELDYTDWQKEYFEEEARDNHLGDYNNHSNI